MKTKIDKSNVALQERMKHVEEHPGSPRSRSLLQRWINIKGEKKTKK